MAAKKEYDPAPEGVEVLARQVTTLDEQIDALQQQRGALVQTIAALVPNVGSYAAGDALVTVRPGSRRLDAKRFEDAYPFEKHPELYKVAPDTTAAKNELGANKLNEFYGGPGARQVVIK